MRFFRENKGNKEVNTNMIREAIAYYKYGITHDIFQEPVTSYAKLAIDALNKQIPKQPDLEGDGYWDGELIYDTGHCPLCGEGYEIDYHTPRYCENCGQALDWED